MAAAGTVTHVREVAVQLQVTAAAHAAALAEAAAAAVPPQVTTAGQSPEA